MINNNKQGVLDTINRVYYNGLTTTSGGNISCMDENGHIFITPSGIDKGSLTIDDIVEVTPDGVKIGKHAPSMELPFHSNIYRERAELRAVVHAHAPAVVAYATARRVPDSRVAPCFERLLGKVCDSEYELPGSLKLGDIVKAKFVEGYNSVMMHNHGATVGGATLEDAYYKYEALDNLCNTLINASVLGGVKLPGVSADYSAKLTPIEGELTASERVIADELASFLRRSYGQKLVSVAYGTLCYKLDNGDILFNPDSVGRDKVIGADIAKYSDGKVIGTRDINADYLDIALKTFEVTPEAKVCFISMPSNLMGFAVSHTYFNARLIPESYIMLKDPLQLEHGIDSVTIAKAMGVTKPIAVIDNECVVTIGKNFTKAFDRMEVAEYSAQSIVQATNIAQITPINDEQTAEIDRTFNGW